jgi:hypothetical protein
MPQFDVYSYPSQVISTLIGLCLFHLFILSFYLSPIAEVLKMRTKLLKMRQRLVARSKKKKETGESVDLFSFFLRKILKKKS